MPDSSFRPPRDRASGACGECPAIRPMNRHAAPDATIPA